MLQHIRLNPQSIQTLETQLHGTLVRPGDADYDEHRAVWNGMIDRYPALIARCASVEDVIASLHFAREHNLVLAVRGGGHNVAGHSTCDDGLVIDLSPMNGVEVDPDKRIARVQGGATWGDVDAAAQVYGLATPGGVVSVTGVAGLTLGGGFGWLRNKHGLSCDNLIAAEVVTVDGQVIRASESANPDLLWGLRGGGGNFGIVTSFEFQLHPVGPEVMFVFVLHDGTGDNMKRGLQFYRKFCASAPDEASTMAVLGKVPPDPGFPEELHEHPYILFGGLYAGSVEEGQRVLQPLLDFSQPILDFSGVKPYVEAQQAWNADYPDGKRYYWKSLNLNRLDDNAIDRLVENARKQPSAHSTIDLWHIGGAVTRVGPDESAFFGRQAAFLLSPEGNWEHADEDAENIQWVRDIMADMQPFSDGSRYLNFAGFQEEGSEMMRKSFGPQYERLVALKKRYDPTNFLRLNQNIQPVAE